MIGLWFSIFLSLNTFAFDQASIDRDLERQALGFIHRAKTAEDHSVAQGFLAKKNQLSLACEIERRHSLVLENCLALFDLWEKSLNRIDPERKQSLLQLRRQHIKQEEIQNYISARSKDTFWHKE